MFLYVFYIWYNLYLFLLFFQVFFLYRYLKLNQGQSVNVVVDYMVKNTHLFFLEDNVPFFSTSKNMTKII